MDKKAKIATIVSLIVVIAVMALMVFAAPKKCNNGLDDDNDGLVDYPNDPGCSSTRDTTETSTSLVCDNGADSTNDRDNLADFRLSGGDPGCTSATDPNEIDGECDDLVDNADIDTLIDYQVSGGDPGCTSTADSSEVDGQCDDTTDNDNDGLSDLSDAGCTSTSDTSELGTAACDNGVDEANDGDTLADHRLSGGDTGCASVTDNDERDGACDDTFDNDGDTFIDFPNDPECASLSDGEGECSDTDGINRFVQGNTYGSFGGVPFNSTDTCVDSLNVTEYFCSGYSLGSQNIACNGPGNSSLQCIDGACV